MALVGWLWLTAAHAAPRTVATSTADLAYVVWSRFVTLADGNRCRLVPSCSRYARLAVRAHGPLGLPMAADRLTRELAVIVGGAPGPDGYWRDPVSDHAVPGVAWTCRAARERGAEVCTGR